MPVAQSDGVIYDRRTITLHWLTALAVLFMWAEAHMIDWFNKGPPRVDARSVHIVVGLLLTGLVAYRLSWRLTGGTRFKYDPSWTGTLTRLTHTMLYVLILATVGLGILNAWIRGDSLFGLGKIPPLGDYSAEARHVLSERITDWHALSANAIFVLGGAHAFMALFHEWVWRDAVLRRMLPGRDF